MVPDGVELQFSDDEDLSGELLQKENNSTNSCSPEIKVETVNINMDAISTSSSMTVVGVNHDSQNQIEAITLDNHKPPDKVTDDHENGSLMEIKMTGEATNELHHPNSIHDTNIVQELSRKDEGYVPQKESYERSSNHDSEEEYSSNYEDEEGTDEKNANPLRKEASEANQEKIDMDEINYVQKNEGRPRSDSKVSEKDESIYNSNNYDSEDYEDATDSENTDGETVSASKVKSSAKEKKNPLCNHNDAPALSLNISQDLNSRVSLYNIEKDELNTHSDGDSSDTSDYGDDFDSDPNDNKNTNSTYSYDSDETVGECSSLSSSPANNVSGEAKQGKTNAKQNTDKNENKDTETVPGREQNIKISDKKNVTKKGRKEDTLDQETDTTTTTKDIITNDVPISEITEMQSDANKQHVGYKTTRSVSSRSEYNTRLAGIKRTIENEKLLIRRHGSVPNSIFKENALLPGKKLYGPPKDILIQSDRKIRQIKADELPSINKISDRANSEKNSVSSSELRTVVNKTDKNNILKKDRVALTGTNALTDADFHLQQRNLPRPLKPICRSSNNGSITATSLSETKDKLQTTHRLNNNKIRRQLNDFNDQLLEIQKHDNRNNEITVEDLDDKEVNDSHSVNQKHQIKPQRTPVSYEMAYTDYARTMNETNQCSKTPYETSTNTEVISKTSKNQTNSIYSDFQDSSCVEKKYELKSEEVCANQYSISTLSGLTSDGNDTSKSATDKTNRNESLITGNELISTSATSDENEYEQNNHFAIKPTEEDTKDSDADYSSGRSIESGDNMEDLNELKFVKNKENKKKPVNKSLYRSHTRPRNIATKAESKSFKYGMERPSSPYIFIGSKAYMRQNSVKSELDVHNEETSTEEYRDKRKLITGLADIARLRDIRRQLRLTDEIHLESRNGHKACGQEHNDTTERGTEGTESASIHTSTAPEVLQGVAAILNDVIRTVSLTAKQPRNILQRRCTATNTEGKDELCCILQAPYFVFNLSVVKCDIIDVHDVSPVTKSRHETLLSNIIKIASQDSGEMGNEAGLVALLPVAESCLQAWQQPIVRVLDGSGSWLDVEGEASVEHVQDGKRTISVLEVHIRNGVTLVVIARPKLDSFHVDNGNVSVTSSLDPRIQVSVSQKPEEIKRCMKMQTIPIDLQTLAWFSRLHNDDDDYQILSCSPLVSVQVSSKHAESLQFRVPYVSLYSRPSKKATMTFPTSCVHSPMPRIPSPYLRQSATEASLRPVVSGRSCNPDNVKTGAQLTPRSPLPRELTIVKSPKRRSKVHIPSGEKHLVLLKEGPGKKMKLVSLSKVHDVTDESVSFSIYENNSSVIVIETRTGLQYSSIGEVTRAFAEFISLKKVTVKVYQTLCDVQALHIDFEDCHNKRSTLVDEAAFYNYSETELLLHEGDVITYSFKGNIQRKKESQTQFCYYSSRGFNASCVIDVQNPYGQRSLPTFHGMLQIFSQSEARAGPIDVTAAIDLDQGWECIVEVPVTLPKVVAKFTPTVNKAPLALELEEPLTPDFMRLLCRDLRNDWERFAKELHIGMARIQSIKQQNKTTIPEKIIMDILANWMKRQPKVSDKASQLISALRRCNKGQLASELRERQKAVTRIRSEAVEDIKLQKAIILVCGSPCASRKWRQIFYHLNQECPNDVTAEANEIEAVYVKDATCCRMALCLWKERTPRPNIWILLDALRACRCTVVADAILAQFSRR